MAQLTVILNSPSEFTTIVTDNTDEICRRGYADNENCSYSKESADMVKPYVSDVIQSVIHRYRVWDIQVQTENQEVDADKFEKTFCENLTTYTQYPNNMLPNLRSAHIKEQCERLFRMSDRELCETVKKYFDSHPTQVGQKDLKMQAVEALKTEGEVSLPAYQRDIMVHQFAPMQVQETTIKGGRLMCDPHSLNCDTIATKNTVTVYKTDVSLQRKTVYKIDVSLQRNEDGSVSVMGKHTDGGEINLGSLQDKFVRNNPMKVDRCSAEVELTDFSNGKMKNLKVRVVVNSDEMSGDTRNLDTNRLAGLKLDNDMLSGLGQDNGLNR